MKIFEMLKYKHTQTHAEPKRTKRNGTERNRTKIYNRSVDHRTVDFHRKRVIINKQ